MIKVLKVCASLKPWLARCRLFPYPALSAGFSPFLVFCAYAFKLIWITLPFTSTHLEGSPVNSIPKGVIHSVNMFQTLSIQWCISSQRKAGSTIGMIFTIGSRVDLCLLWPHFTSAFGQRKPLEFLWLAGWM